MAPTRYKQKAQSFCARHSSHWAATASLSGFLSIVKLIESADIELHSCQAPASAAWSACALLYLQKGIIPQHDLNIVRVNRRSMELQIACPSCMNRGC